MKKKITTIIAARYRPIKMKIVQMREQFVLKVNRLPFIRFKEIRSPLEELKTLPALKVAKTNFYTKTKISFSKRSTLETLDMRSLLKQQSDMMKAVIDQSRAEIHQETLKRFKQTQEKRQQL